MTDPGRDHDARPLAAALRVWPSVIGVSTLAFIHVLAYWTGNVVALSSADELRETAYGQPVFVWGSIVAALLLVPWVVYDVWRHKHGFWQVSRVVIGGMLLLVLAALLRLLWSATALL